MKLNFLDVLGSRLAGWVGMGSVVEFGGKNMRRREGQESCAHVCTVRTKHGGGRGG